MITAKKIILILFILFSCFIYANSQNKLNHLENAYHSSLDSTERYLKINPNKALSNAINALEIGKKLKSEEKIGYAYLQIGILYRLKGELIKSELYLEKSLSLSKKYKHYPVLLKELGITLKQQSKFKFALDYYLEALAIFRSENKDAEIATIYNNIGRLYFSMGDNDNALTNYKESLKIKSSRVKNSSIGITYHNIGAVKENKNEIDSALYYYRKALSYYQKENDKILIAYGYASIGNILPHLDSAEIYLKTSLTIRSSLDLSADVLESNLYLGRLRYKQFKYNEATVILKEVYEKSAQSLKFHYSYESAKLLVESYQKMNNPELALFYEKKASSWRDSIHQYEKKVKELGFEYRLKEIKQKEKLDRLSLSNKLKDKKLLASQSELEKEKQIQIYWMITLLLSIFILLLISFFLYNQYKKNKKLSDQKREIEQKNNENEVLVREVHHRVKNNLNSVLSMLRLEKRKYNSSETTSLVENMEKRILTVSYIHEILYNQNDITNISLNHYFSTIGIQILSLHQNENIKLIVTGEINFINAEQAITLGQLIAELITNSIKHAFTSIENPTITVELNHSTKNKITYIDNGKGFDGSNISKSFGTKLIESHCRKLNGQMSYDSSSFYKFELEF